MMTLGTENANEVETPIDSELEAHHERAAPPHTCGSAHGGTCMQLGIVAAVLGVIHTMGSITEPRRVLGHLIERRWSALSSAC